MSRCRDENGRFCKKESNEDEKKTEIIIKIPFGKYLPFLCILLAFLVVSSPWLFIFPKFLKKMMMEIGISLLQSAMAVNETIKVTNCEGIGGTCPGK